MPGILAFLRQRLPFQLFLTAQAEQLSKDSYLHASYASSFNDLAYLAMRLSYLVAVESNKPD